MKDNIKSQDIIGNLKAEGRLEAGKTRILPGNSTSNLYRPPTVEGREEISRIFYQ